ncbi:MAG: thioredoxin-dependent thiol peroxidase [Spirochaetaceae bacterium]|nr:thioredoxin-dependent thiol peroxidase [Spirochaetaceae bacterium]MDT8298815.1 thioredoxin-dependent thiol peroxidase [Spirochaetaceae bacterium]
MLKEGDKAPAFTLKNEEDKDISLADFTGKKTVVYFYPKDDTPGCTKEACGFRDVYDQILAKGGVVLGISADSVKSHAEFKSKFDLPFHLLSDPEKKVIQGFGAWGVKSMYGKEYEGIIRSTFVLDGAGTVIKAFPKVKPADHAAEILGLL